MSIYNKSSLTVIGVGPGDPELLTLKAHRALAQADFIFAPSAAIKKESLALSIAQGAFQEGELKAEIIKLVYPMTRDRDELEKYWDLAAQEVGQVLQSKGGIKAVFITLGDPSLYSTWSYLRQRLEVRNIPYTLIPGIPSFFLGAALTGRELAIGDEKLAVIPMPGSQQELETLMKTFDTLVLMKIGRAMGDLRSMLEKSGYISQAWIVSRCGLKDEQFLPFAQQVDDSIGYLSHVIIYKGEDVV